MLGFFCIFVSKMKNIPNIEFQSKENKIDFELLKLSDLFNRFNNSLDDGHYKPHRIKFFALLLVTNGSGSHQIDLKKYDIKEGTVLKIARGQVHSFQRNPQFDGYLILFTDDFVFNYLSKSTISLIEHLYNYHLSSPVVCNLELNNSFLNQLITEIETENVYAKNNIIASLLSLYLLKLDRESHNKENSDYSSIHYNTFIQFKNLVQSKFTITRNVKDYAVMMLVSNKKINSAVKHYTLDTAKNFIDNYVTLEATRAIVSTEKSIKEIAYDVGFEEVTNFTKFFKNKIGVSPNTFRLKNK